jgi:hypothetical protein
LSDGNWFKTVQVGSIGGLALLAYAVIVFQGVVSLTVLLTDKQKWVSRSLRDLTFKRSIRLVLLASCLSLMSVSIMSFVSAYDQIGYVIQLMIATGMVAATLAGALALLFASDLGNISLPENVLAYLDRHVFVLVPLVFFVIAILYSVFAFGMVPVVEDETAYLFQAKTIAGGGFRAPELPAAVSEQMEFYLIENNASGWYATTVAGWPAVLSLGVMIGLPWLVNPVLGTLSVVLGMALWRRVINREQAIIVGVLMIASPWLLEISVSWMTHALVLALSLGSWYLIAMTLDRAKYRLVFVSSMMFAAGLLMGWIFFTRALEGVIIGGLTGVCLLWIFGRQRKLVPILAYGMGCLATGSLYFLYNYHMTGEILTTPLMAYLTEIWGEGANAFGFGPEIGPPSGWGNLDLWPGHSLGEAVINLNNSLSALNTELFGWSSGSLFLLLIFVIWRRPRGIEAAMAALAGIFIIIHVFYWFSGTFYIGPRYWFGAFFAFIVLSAGGLEVIRQMFRHSEGEHFDRRLSVLLMIFCGFSITVFSTWRGVERYAPRTQHARIMSNYQLPSAISSNAVIALPCQRLFEGAMHLNDPYLRKDTPVFVFSPNAESIETVRIAFPDRSIIYVDSLQQYCGR